MSLFGDLDLDDYDEDPFATKPGTYKAIVTDAKVSEKDGNTSLIIQYSIDEPTSEYHKNNVSQFNALFPGKDSLEPAERKRLKFTLSTLRQGFDLSMAEIKDLEPSQLIGREVFITVKNSPATDGSGRTYTNIQNVISPEKAAERGVTSSVSEGAEAASSALGL